MIISGKPGHRAIAAVFRTAVPDPLVRKRIKRLAGDEPEDVERQPVTPGSVGIVWARKLLVRLWLNA
jgi:hypothetical protein